MLHASSPRPSHPPEVTTTITNASAKDVALVERSSICLPKMGSDSTLHHGDDMFNEHIARFFAAPENNALEEVVNLKQQSQGLPNDEFFSHVTEKIAKIVGADMSFIMKRVLVDEQNAAIEMPPHGDPGSCMMAAAFYYQTDDGTKQTMQDCKFHAYSCPCAFMRHDKVFLIPERFNEFITNNPNTLPFPAEAYLALPLSADEKCFGHFGCMWSSEAAAKRTLSWAFIEMLMHSLEDMIIERISEGANLNPKPKLPRDRSRIIPHEAITAAQSLRPYAGSLSHELRTPMQGVVGMLDVMYATVQETAESLQDPKLRKVFDSLRDSIEVVQDSSRRAVEAADNVVHAYDMNMIVPEQTIEFTPEVSNETAIQNPSAASPEPRSEISVTNSNLPLVRAGTNKRRWDADLTSTTQYLETSGTKFQKIDGAYAIWSRNSRMKMEEVRDTEPLEAHNTTEELGGSYQPPTSAASSSTPCTTRAVAPGLRHTRMRDVFKHVIDEGLKLGGRPDTMLASETTHGESVEVRSRGSDGHVSSKIIDWSVDPSVPEKLFIDEKDLSKLVSCVFLNALKFADQQDGRISIHAEAKSRNRYIVITIKDNGPGIPSAFLPKLFKPFSQENRSITRQSDGLGLGLLVGKGIARKLGGDLTITKAETEGPEHGSEFEIKVPLLDGETITRASSPFGSPRPRASTLSKVDIPQSPIVACADEVASPTRLAAALHAAVNNGPLHHDQNRSTSSTPPSVSLEDKLGISAAVRDITSYPATTQKIPRGRKPVSTTKVDRELATKYPLSILVAEDNKINRRLLVSMLNKLGYKDVHEAHDGSEAVRQMKLARRKGHRIDVILMDLWMPLMDGYEATEQILHSLDVKSDIPPTVLAVTADVTEDALERAAQVGMTGFMTKPYKMLDLQRLITEYCA
ncbi:histidine kinase [Acrodontium crateriforme]|uniref:histidine kinase n=1 Tax=Acrodontium crateriforme TaxID=150365 RepID=A0AAQ3M843_9PEZI|nr:histidine kinase [Acrodontium crateriforme]